MQGVTNARCVPIRNLVAGDDRAGQPNEHSCIYIYMHKTENSSFLAFLASNLFTIPMYNLSGNPSDDTSHWQPFGLSAAET